MYAAALAASKRFLDHREFPVWDIMEMFLDSYVDDSPFKRRILDGRGRPRPINANFKAIMPAVVLNPKPGNGPLGKASDRTSASKTAAGARQLLQRRYKRFDRVDRFCTEYMQGLICEVLDHQAERLESKDDLSAVLQDISAERLRRPAPLSRGIPQATP